MTEQSPDKTNPVRWNVFVVDDHPIFRHGIVQLINSEPDFLVCGEASSAPQALSALRTVDADAAVIDVSLQGANGIELLKQIRAEHPDLPVLMLSMHDEKHYALRALRAGPAGYIMKREDVDTFLTALRRVVAGETVVSPTFGQELIYRVVSSENSQSDSPINVLTDREVEVLQHIGEGRSSREIATDLNLSVKTVESHRLHMKEKLRLKNAAELVRFATDWVAQQSESSGDAAEGETAAHMAR
ncbi:MAG: response regulator [Chthoniobacteraceae bacterium]